MLRASAITCFHYLHLVDGRSIRVSVARDQVSLAGSIAAFIANLLCTEKRNRSWYVEESTIPKSPNEAPHKADDFGGPPR